MIRLLALAVLVLVAGCAPSVVPPPAQPAVTIERPPPVAPDVIDVPEWIEIPRLGVVDEIVPVELAPDRTMSVPPVDVVGWYALGVLVGERGPAVLPGHRDYDGVPGSFKRLDELAVGDQILISGDGDEQLTFEVYRVDTFPKSAFRTDLIYGDRDTADVVLVTCGGAVVDHSYLDNTAVTARLVAA